MQSGGHLSQLALFDKGPQESQARRSSTFAENLSLPVHRWFKYSAGFSALWVNELIASAKAPELHVLDPFAGSGTVLLEAEACGVQSLGLEAHPFVARVAAAKLHWNEPADDLLSAAEELLSAARRAKPSLDRYPPLIRKCFPDASLVRLAALHRAWDELSCGAPIRELLWLTLVAILRPCSPVGTANWQYVLPNKTKARFLEPFDAYRRKVSEMAGDMAKRQALCVPGFAKLHRGDARSLSSVPAGWADLVVTSPPYPNNFDYADATRLEQSFLGEINGWGELQNAVRQHLIRSCSQHVQGAGHDSESILSDALLDPIRAPITEVCIALEKTRHSHGGKKAYHTMIAGYFLDMARCWQALRGATANDCLVCFVIGDSAPYGVYVPVERWLAELALASGFKSWRFEKTRDRNTKWKNRKHRVPLHEGRLWVKG
jgi:hypothetical protein